MPQKIDLTGQVFGRLTVIEEEIPRKTKRIRWICQCECGTIKAISSNDLRMGKTLSCGCLRNDKVRQAIGNKLEGQRFGKLIVLEQVNSILEPSGILRTAWKCHCDCGNDVIVKTINLKSGDTTSCGCSISKGEEKISRILRENNVNFSSQYVFEDLLSENGSYLKFDFAVFEKNKLSYLIEYNGIQHYEVIDHFGGKENFKKQQNNDLRKIEYCKSKKIPLIIISYQDYEEINYQMIEEKYNEALLGYRKNEREI